jgi:hypothetical protein
MTLYKIKKILLDIKLIVNRKLKNYNFIILNEKSKFSFIYRKNIFYKDLITFKNNLKILLEKNSKYNQINKNLNYFNHKKN